MLIVESPILVEYWKRCTRSSRPSQNNHFGRISSISRNDLNALFEAKVDIVHGVVVSILHQLTEANSHENISVLYEYLSEVLEHLLRSIDKYPSMHVHDNLQ